MVVIDLFYRYGCHIEFTRFKEYYGLPKGHSLSIYARFSCKKRTSLNISQEKGDYYYIQTRHNDLFCHYNLFLGKLKEKLARKARVNTERVYRVVLMPPGHPIILLESNEFDMAAVSVKRSICLHCLKCKHCKFDTHPPLIWIMFTSSLVETLFRQLLFLVPLKL